MMARVSKAIIRDLVYKVNGAAIEVHRTVGPGLLESVYHKCLKTEFEERGILYESEIAVPINYKGTVIYTDLRCDFLVEQILPVEIKSIEYILPVHEAQMLTYMKLLNAPLGLMINFNCINIYENGQKTYVNELYRVL